MPADLRVAAVLVVYHSQATPDAVAASLLSRVDRLVVVDNSAAGHPCMERLPDDARLHRLHHRNVGGLAGAYNAALRILSASDPALTHVVFVDEDSDVAVLQQFLADPEVRRVLDDSATGAASPAHRDRRTGLRARHMRLTRWRISYLPRDFAGIERVTFLINSMAVWRLDALRRLGPFDEFLAVDHVDTDMCLRAQAAGLTQYLCGRFEFQHTIGDRTSYRFLGATLQSGGHSPGRRFMIGRNTACLARRYAFRMPAFSLLCLLRIGYEALGILMVEADRAAKLRSLMSGAWGGVRTRPGMIPRPE